MKLNFFNDYHSRANGENILHVFHKDIGSRKAFQIIPRVFIIPELIGYRDPSEDYMANKLTSVKEKSIYLKQMSMLFARLNSVKLGRSLLNVMSKMLPLSYKVEGNNKLLILDDENSMVSSRKKLNAGFKENEVENITEANIVITVNNSTIISPEVAAPRRTSPYSSTSRLNISPELVLGYMNKDKKLIYSDPAVVLAHELIHCLRGQYSAIRRYEEDIAYGIPKKPRKSDNLQTIHVREDIQKRRKYIQDLLENVCVILNNIDKKDAIQQKLYKVYAKKYLFKIKKNQKLSVTKSQIDSLHYTIYYKFSETKFTNIFHNAFRTNYRDSNMEGFYILDASNDKHYNIKDGIIIKNEKLPKHPFDKYYHKHKLPSRVKRDISFENSQIEEEVENTLFEQAESNEELSMLLNEDCSDETQINNDDEIKRYMEHYKKSNSKEHG